jgi:hypothetical protein
MVIVTDIKTKNSLEAKANSLVYVTAWDNDFNQAQEIALRMPLVIPTKKSNFHNFEKLKKSKDFYEQFLTEKYSYKLEKEKDPKKRILLENYLNEIKKIKLKRINDQVYHLIGPHTSKKERKILSEEFIEESLQKQAERRIKYYGIINDNRITKERLPLEDILRGECLSLDYETQGWEKIELEKEYSSEELKTLINHFSNESLVDYSKNDLLRKFKNILEERKDERITGVILTNLNKDISYLITTLPKYQDEIEVNIPGSKKKLNTKIINVKNEKELIKVQNELLKSLKFLYVVGHNHMKFDYGKAKELEIGALGEKPKHKAQIPGGFIVQKIAPGYLDLDFSGYSQHAMDLKNNKLDTVFEYLTGLKNKKILTHQELSKITAQAEKGDLESIIDWNYYTAQDGIKNCLNAEKLRKEIVALSYLFNSRTARICSTSKKTLSIDYWKNKSYHDNQTDCFIDKEFENFNSFDYLNKKIKLKTKKGIYKGNVYALFPLSTIFNEVLSRDENMNFFNQVIETSDFKTKLRLLKYKEKIAELLLYNDLNCLDDFIEQLNNVEIINYSDHIYVTENRSNFLDKYGLNLGEHTIISGTKGRFSNLEMLMLKGIADYDSNQGERSQLEKDFYKNFFEILTSNDKERFIDYLEDFCYKINNLEFPQEKYLFKRKIHKNHYSSEAKQDYVERIREKGLKKGDKLCYQLPIEQYHEKLFGKEGTISTIVSWVFDKNKFKTELNSIYNGEKNPIVKEILKNHLK